MKLQEKGNRKDQLVHCAIKNCDFFFFLWVALWYCTKLGVFYTNELEYSWVKLFYRVKQIITSVLDLNISIIAESNQKCIELLKATPILKSWKIAVNFLTICSLNYSTYSYDQVVLFLGNKSRNSHFIGMFY